MNEGKTVFFRSFHSLKGRIQLRIILFAILPFIILCAVVCILLITNVRTEFEDGIQAETDRLADGADSILSKYQRISTSVLNQIIVGSSRVFSDGYYALDGDYALAVRRFNLEMDFYNSESNMPRGDKHGFTIFVENYAGYKGKYIENLEEFEEQARIEGITRTPSDEFLWDGRIVADDRGNEYLVFYRNFSVHAPRKKFIRMYIPYNEITNLVESSPLFASSVVAHIGSNGRSLYTWGAERRIPRGSIATSSPILPDGSYLLVVSSASQIWGDYLRLLLYTLLAVVLGTFLIFFVSNIASRRLVTGLDDFMDHLNNDDLLINTKKVEIEKDESELSIIKKRFLGLLEKVNEINRDFGATKSENHRLELELMQARINPHLLYNSLSALKWDALRNANHRTVSLINSMISYYRAALNRGETVIELGKELEMIEQYINVFNFSRGTHHTLRLEVSEKIKNIRVLKHVLQPLVENSVVHGFAGLSESGEVRISASLDGGDVVFVVRDNGRGMNDGKIEEISNSNYRPARGGYGISNTMQRLKLHYGDGYGLRIESKENEYTQVTIRERYAT